MLLRELYDTRELCFTLARKDFFVRYRRAAFGALWAVVMPALQAIVLSIVLKRVTTIKIEHYVIFIFSGIVTWTYFSGAVSAGSTAIVDSSGMSSRIYFPRAVNVLSVGISNLYTLFISTVVLLIAMIVTGAEPGWHSFYLLAGEAMTIAVAVSLSLVLAATHVYFRDTRYAVQAALYVWFYVTPVFYPSSVLKGTVHHIVQINPMTGPTQLMHAGAIGGVVQDPTSLAVAGGWIGVLGALAIVLHSRFDRVFADLL